MVAQGGHSPADVADQLDLTLGDIYSALAYYHEHPDEMRELRCAQEEATERLAERALSPPEPTT